MSLKRYDIINTLIYHFGYKSYLEIGTQWGINFEQINIEEKHCVDPDNSHYPVTYHCTSDEFFSQCTRNYDIIFLDGLHTEEQLKKDIDNALLYLSDNGTIVCHDCLPSAPEDIALDRNGTSFRAIIDQRQKNYIEMAVVDADCGCAIIRRGLQPTYSSVVCEQLKDLNAFNAHKKEAVNVITVSEFMQEYGRKS